MLCFEVWHPLCQCWLGWQPVTICLQGALQQNLVADKDVTLAARRVLEARWALSDPPC